MYLIMTFILITSVNNFYFLFPWSKIEGQFNTIDIGIVFLCIFIFFSFIKSKNLKYLRNPFSLFIIVLIFMVLINIFYTKYRYNISYLNAIVASRYYLYYFSFFFFLIALDSPKGIKNVLNLMTYLSIILVALSVINYFGPVIFYHKWAEGHFERLGIKRAFIPNMSMVSFCTVWSFCEMFSGSGKIGFSSGWKSIYLLAAHIFRQSRMRLLSVLFVFLLLSVHRAKSKKMLQTAVVIIASASIIFFVLGQNLLKNQITMTYEEIKEKKGTWGGRVLFMKTVFNELMKSPILGTGASAIRANPEAYKNLSKNKLQLFHVLGKQTDLGYLNWLKNFGLVGLIWLIMFFVTLLRYGLRVIKYFKDENESLALFGLFYSIFIFVSFLTINHLGMSDGIFHLCFTAAVLVHLDFLHKEKKG